MKLILLSGKQGSGKTSLQKMLVGTWRESPRYGHAIACNFADILYEMHDEVLCILHRYWPKRDLVKDGPLLQLLGTEWGRGTIDKDIWVKLLRAKLDQINKTSKTGLVVIGDCRFENEFDAFPEALRVRLYCPKEIRKPRCEMWRENSKHPSEVGLDDYYRQNKFDLVLKTHHEPTHVCVDKVLYAIETRGQTKPR